MSTGRALVQLVFALGAVLALLLLVSKVLGRAGSGRKGSNLEVLARRQLAKGASVAVVQVGSRALVLGVSEQGVRLLSEAEAAEFTAPVEETAEDGEAADGLPTPGRPGRRARTLSTPGGALAGSVLSPATWRQTAEVLRERTTRRG
ncbi:flagellar protein FliO/FliZ [Motilibacter rhizosphaerae]|uniref:Flagellar protein FliO/FliZ n=1 Tax=Motilibacter rhizosphaerae TaxID=598652 RepID=A0A4Q7NWZ5_9ACTN|nr:flagellar biosynthetic protein FliO [Motilibacter rhizosphaerae]RZS91438.1 flagellar protein FliO/FliZ [Motilibacter rhizosphaerae]